MGAAAAPFGTLAIQTYAIIGAAIVALGLPLYQLHRDGLLPPLRRRHDGE
jgi:hypothetical protein